MSPLLRLLFISITTTITIHSKIVDSQPSIPPPSDGGVGQFVPAELWCVAKNNAEDAVLQSAMDWACGQGGADCRPIQSGGPCFEPNNLQAHASFAFNDYFLKNGPSSQSCDFGGAAALTSLNPSSGSCVLPSSGSMKNGSMVGPTGLGGPMDENVAHVTKKERCWPVLVAVFVLLVSVSVYR